MKTPPKRRVTVGVVAGGASAAARARRRSEDCEIIIFERGPHPSFANCRLPCFVGGEIEMAERLVRHGGISLSLVEPPPKPQSHEP